MVVAAHFAIFPTPCAYGIDKIFSMQAMFMWFYSLENVSHESLNARTACGETKERMAEQGGERGE